MRLYPLKDRADLDGYGPVPDLTTVEPRQDVRKFMSLFHRIQNEIEDRLKETPLGRVTLDPRWNFDRYLDGAQEGYGVKFLPIKSRDERDTFERNGRCTHSEVEAVELARRIAWKNCQVGPPLR